ncbi:DUF4391 domain-containing protein [Lacticaseibacillus saniviri]|nr:DUF4391 domain-containing protein [Lacticaseibacillus saniviri]
MDTKDIVRWWQFPAATVINKNLPKTQVFPHIRDAKDKKLLTDAVQSIYMLADFKPENTNIPAFQSDEELYSEVWFYYVKTKENEKSEKIYRLLSKIIPYPIVVLTEFQDEFRLYTGRSVRQSTDFLKLIRIYPSPSYSVERAPKILENLAVSKLPRSSLKTLYDGLQSEITQQLTAVQFGVRAETVTTYEKDRLDELSKRIETLRKKIKGERQLNRKIEMQMELKKRKDELQSVLKKTGRGNDERK